MTHYLCCQHLSGPNPDPAGLAAHICATLARLDELAFPQDRIAYECECSAAAKHRVEYLGAAVFLCNPCLDALLLHHGLDEFSG